MNKNRLSVLAVVAFTVSFAAFLYLFNNSAGTEEQKYYDLSNSLKREADGYLDSAQKAVWNKAYVYECIAKHDAKIQESEHYNTLAKVRTGERQEQSRLVFYVACFASLFWIPAALYLWLHPVEKPS